MATTMTMDDVIRKVQSLFRLSKSANPNEAAVAAAKAQELMDRYKLSSLSTDLEGDRSGDEAIRDWSDDPLERTSKMQLWKVTLGSVLADYNACKVYMLGSNTMLVGRPSDVATIRYLYAWLTREVDRLCNRDCKGYGILYRNSYRRGVVDTIRQLLREQRRKTQESMRQEAISEDANLGPLWESGFKLASASALTRIDNAIAIRDRQARETEEWAKENMKFGKGRSYRVNDDYGARAKGRAAGKEISLAGARGRITA